VIDSRGYQDDGGSAASLPRHFEYIYECDILGKFMSVDRARIMQRPGTKQEAGIFLCSVPSFGVLYIYVV